VEESLWPNTLSPATVFRPARRRFGVPSEMFDPIENSGSGRSVNLRFFDCM
jgi:hypothetical protein